MHLRLSKSFLVMCILLLLGGSSNAQTTSVTEPTPTGGTTATQKDETPFFIRNAFFNTYDQAWSAATPEQKADFLSNYQQKQKKVEVKQINFVKKQDNIKKTKEQAKLDEQRKKEARLAKQRAAEEKERNEEEARQRKIQAQKDKWQQMADDEARRQADRDNDTQHFK